MYIKSLTITRNGINVREPILFHKGLNLIVDDTPEYANSGGGVGKTTLLRFIDFCLGMRTSWVWTEPDSKTVDKPFKEHFSNHKVLLTLVLVDDLDKPTCTVEIQRQVANGRKAICTVQGKSVTPKELEQELRKLLFPKILTLKPTFRQLISHNIRHTSEQLQEVFGIHAGSPNSDEDQETLMLNMLGCPVSRASDKVELMKVLKKEREACKRLEQTGTYGDLMSQKERLEADIDDLIARKRSLDVNAHWEQDINELNGVRRQLNTAVSELNALELRRKMIYDTIAEHQSERFEEDHTQLRRLYEQAGVLHVEVACTFEQLVDYHNAMLRQRIKFVKEDLLVVDRQIKELRTAISQLRTDEKALVKCITTTNAYDTLDNIIGQLHRAEQEMDQCEYKLAALEAHFNTIDEIELQLKEVETDLYSKEYKEEVERQVNRLNDVFARLITLVIEGEDDDDIGYPDRPHRVMVNLESKGDKHIYRFTPEGMESSKGLKRSAIACFDMAYTEYADRQGIDCMHFLLYDRLESVSNKQLLRLNEVLQTSNVQCILSILKHKLPEELCTDENIVLQLSEDDKLMRMEQYDLNAFVELRRQRRIEKAAKKDRS